MKKVDEMRKSGSLVIHEDTGKIQAAQVQAEQLRSAAQEAVDQFNKLDLGRDASAWSILQFLSNPRQIVKECKLATIGGDVVIHGVRIKAERLLELGEIDGKAPGKYYEACRKVEDLIKTGEAYKIEMLELRDGKVLVNEGLFNDMFVRPNRVQVNGEAGAEIHYASVDLAAALQRLDDAIKADGSKTIGIFNGKHLRANRIETYVKVEGGVALPNKRWAILRKMGSEN